MEVLGTLISEAAPRGGRSGRLGALLCSGCPQDPPPPALCSHCHPTPPHRLASGGLGGAPGCDRACRGAGQLQLHP